MLGGLDEFSRDAIPLQPRQMIDEQDPVQMIDFMLQAGRQKSIRFDFLDAAVPIGVAGTHPGRTLDLLEKIWDRQAALLIEGKLVRRPENFWIDDTERFWRGGLVLAFRDVKNENPLRHRDLDRGKTDAGRRIHGLKHIVHQRVNACVDRGHRRAFVPQTRIREGQYRPYSHDNEIMPAPPEVNLSGLHFLMTRTG
jgi:hypothetical protein